VDKLDSFDQSIQSIFGTSVHDVVQGWLKNDVYTEESRQKCEDTIVKISRESIDFTPLFKDATDSKIFYVKFRMTIMGEVEWKLVETPKDKSEEKKTQKRVSFRSKNFVGRAKDKLGFQV
jgi:hypothetical protein